MKLDQTICLVMGGYTIGGYLCKPDAPTRAWAIGFIALFFATIAAYIFAPENAKP